MQNKTPIYLILYLLFLVSCKVENLDEKTNFPKTDFSHNNYVLVTEDASDVDITTFYTFNLKDIYPEEKYDLLGENHLFINSNPSTSSGHIALNQYIYSFAKDKKGYSSTPGLYRLGINDENRVYIESELNISRDNLFPARQLCIVNEKLGYFYDEGKAPQSIQIFDPTDMRLTGKINLEEAIREFRPDAKWTDVSGNNLIRTGTTALEENQGKLYVSIAFLEQAAFNLIAESEKYFYLAVIDVSTNKVEKIIQYEGIKTVSFYVSENKGTSKDENGNLYFCSWGWNQFNAHNPSIIFRIKSGETDFDPDWVIDIEKLFGKTHIAQSMISYNNKIYLHVSEDPYPFGEDEPGVIQMGYYEFDPEFPDVVKKLDIPHSDTSSRMNVFSIVDDKLYISVPNIIKRKFNGYYSIDRNSTLKKEITIENKYRPTRLYKLHN